MGKKYKLKYIEGSAKEDINIYQAFKELTTEICKKNNYRSDDDSN